MRFEAFSLRLRNKRKSEERMSGDKKPRHFSTSPDGQYKMQFQPRSQSQLQSKFKAQNQPQAQSQFHTPAQFRSPKHSGSSFRWILFWLQLWTIIPFPISCLWSEEKNSVCVFDQKRIPQHLVDSVLVTTMNQYSLESIWWILFWSCFSLLCALKVPRRKQTWTFTSFANFNN